MATNHSFMWSAFLVISLFSIVTTRHPQLRLVNVIFRHGDRAPSAGSEMYPNEPYTEKDFYPMGRGGLTNQGKRREYKLGSILRDRYKQFLGTIYTSELLRTRSTNYERTKMSLQLVLASLFPPEPIQKWNKFLNWQPIPNSYVPEDEDILLIPEECPQYLAEQARVLKLSKVMQEISEYKEFMDNLTQLSGKLIVSPYDMYNLYLGFAAASSMGLPLPKWSENIFPNGKLLNGTLLYYDLFSYNTFLKRLNGGMLVREFAKNMKKVHNGSLEEGRKLFLYSGHETNIAALLQALGVYKPHVPEFSSAVIVELYQLQDTYYVQIAYYLGIPPEIVKLTIPGCSVLCPFDKFLNLMANVLPSNEDMMCNKKDKKPTENMEKVAQLAGLSSFSVTSIRRNSFNYW